MEKEEETEAGPPRPTHGAAGGVPAGPTSLPLHLKGGVRDGWSDLDREAASKRMASGREAETEGATSRRHPQPHIHSATTKSGRREL